MVCDLLQKIELFHAAGTQMFPPHGPEIVKTFYDILTVLDSKGLALLAFDGIVVAATTLPPKKVASFTVGEWRDGWRFDHHPVSDCRNFMPFGLRNFLLVHCTAPDRLDFSDEITRLSTLVDWRTEYYQISRWCSMIAIPLFFVLFWGSLSWKNSTAAHAHEPERVH